MTASSPRRSRYLGTLFTVCGLALAVASAPARAVTPVAPSPDSFDLSAYKGKVVYLDFWASWCATCKLSFPFMRTMSDIFGNQNFVVLTVNLDRDKAAAQAFLRKVGSDLPVVFDPGGKLATRYKVASMPTSILIGKDGRIREIHRGFFDNKTADYEQQIAALVDERS